MFGHDLPAPNVAPGFGDDLPVPNSGEAPAVGEERDSNGTGITGMNMRMATHKRRIGVACFGGQGQFDAAAALHQYAYALDEAHDIDSTGETGDSATQELDPQFRWYWQPCSACELDFTGRGDANSHSNSHAGLRLEFAAGDCMQVHLTRFFLVSEDFKGKILAD